MTIRWTQQLSVGHPGLDEQHRQWLSILNDLAQAVEQGRGPEAVGEALDRLADYTETHFAEEEALFSPTAYPDTEGHREKHEQMRQRLARLRQEQRQGLRFVSLEVLQFLQDWLTEHIMKTDKAYARYICAAGVPGRSEPH